MALDLYLLIHCGGLSRIPCSNNVDKPARSGMNTAAAPPLPPPPPPTTTTTTTTNITTTTGGKIVSYVTFMGSYWRAYTYDA